MTIFILGALAGVIGTLAFSALWAVSDAQAHADTETRPLLGVVHPEDTR